MIDKNQNLPKKETRGGPRPGSGRPKGSKDAVTVRGLLEALELQNPTQSYEEILVEDFNRARQGSDTALVLKYHNLILNKIMSTKLSVDINESEDSLAAKREAFADALADLTGIKNDNQPKS